MISIALATYNGEKYLAEQLDSLINQTIIDFEIVIYDDCSNDNTVEIIKEYQKKDTRIKYYINENNLGFTKNFENIIKKCTGDYIALCDQDDVWTPNHLEILMLHIKDCALVCGNAILIDAQGTSMEATMMDMYSMRNILYDKINFFSHEVYGNICQGAACMFKKELRDLIIPIPENVKFHDYWIALNACLYGGGRYVDKEILYYRQHGNNVTINNKWNLKNRFINLFKYKSKYIESKVELLQMLLLLKKREPITNIQLPQLSNGIKYTENIIFKKNWKNIKIFYKEYENIFLRKKTDVYNFIIRFIRYFIFNG